MKKYGTSSVCVLIFATLYCSPPSPPPSPPPPRCTYLTKHAVSRFHVYAYLGCCDRYLFGLYPLMMLNMFSSQSQRFLLSIGTAQSCINVCVASPSCHAMHTGTLIFRFRIAVLPRRRQGLLPQGKPNVGSLQASSKVNLPSFEVTETFLNRASQECNTKLLTPL